MKKLEYQWVGVTSLHKLPRREIFGNSPSLEGKEKPSAGLCVPRASRSIQFFLPKLTPLTTPGTSLLGGSSAP
jgi:hypothetical protein